MHFSKGSVQQEVFDLISRAKCELDSPCEISRREAAAKISVLQELARKIRDMKQKKKE